MQWLFGSASEPYRGKDVRCAHLKLIKRKGLTPDHFDMAATYFADSLRECDVAEVRWWGVG